MPPETGKPATRSKGGKAEAEEEEISWDALEEIALGELELSEMEFYALTPRTFANLLKGRRKKEEVAFKDRWEQTRLIVVSSLLPHLGKGANKSIQKIYPLPWDKENGKPKIEIDPQEAAKNAQAFWDKIDKKKEK